MMKLFKTKQYTDEYGVYYLLNNSKVYIRTEDYNIPLYTHLNYKYNDILWEMLKDEFYIIQDKVYDIVKEIVYEGEVVGFTTLNFYKDVLIMELCYILPEYRNKGLFCNEISQLKEYFEYIIWLDLPNRFAINSLVDNGLACMVNEFIVKSGIPLSFRHPLEGDVRLSTCYYDLRICGSVYLKNYLVSPLLDVDVVFFNAGNVRDELLSEFYFTDFLKLL